MITLEQVTAEEARAEQAVQERDAAGQKLSESPYSELAAHQFTDASKRAAQVAASAKELREAFEAQATPEQLADERRRLEKAATAEITAAGAELETRRKALEKGAEAAQKALVELLDCTFAYNRAVAAHAKTLQEKGLDVPLTGRLPSTGGGKKYGGLVVMLDGERWPQVDAGAVSVWVLHRVGAARLPGRHPVAESLKFFPGCVEVQAIAGQLFGRLPEPKVIEYSPLPRPRMAQV